MKKLKRIILIAVGFGLATYFIMSGMAMLNQESNTASEVHSNTVE